jgi:uncharacterized protein
MHHFLSLGPAELHARPSGALFWPKQSLLVVADLHFGRSERLARRGGALLPPYETRATLERLDAELETTGARRVLCLGDSFDDLGAADALAEDDQMWIARLMAGRDWTWVLGNHDPGPLGLGGTCRDEMALAGLTFRHIAETGARLEVSAHYHPKARLAGTARPCFLADAQRIILPAFGTYTGGLWCDHPDLGRLMSADAVAILTGTRAIAFPMPR